jgi:phage terminase large subunit-like protein
VTYPYSEIISCANDEEQSQSRVFATAVALCTHNPALKASVVKMTQNEIRFTNGSVIRAIAADYKGASGGRQRVTIFDELWAFDQGRMTRLYEEMRPPPTVKGAYLFITSYAGFSGESTVSWRKSTSAA